MAELRREQAEQHQRADRAERDNILWSLPAFAPVALAAGLEVAGALGAEAVFPQLARPLSFLEREIWQNPALGDAEKTALRELARKKFGRATGASARNLGAEVHHSNPLEFAHLWPKADPNRLANLWALPRATHQIATREWAAFRAGLRGRPPTQAEIMAAKLRIDRMVESQIRRPGLPRPKTPPTEGGSQ